MNKRVKSSSIRLIAGQWRGRRLPVINSLGLRPTTDRVRETVFNWLMHEIAGARCLDLFAGTGALGLECLSRGASEVQFVEADKRVAAALRENLLQLKVGEEAALVEANSLRFLRTVPRKPFDLVFLDPPFQSDLLPSAIELLQSDGWLSSQAIVYVEQSTSAEAVVVPASWDTFRHAKAGQSSFSLYTV